MMKYSIVDFNGITGLLRASLGEPDKLHQTSPLYYCESSLEVLIATILTQATSDKNALRAWNNFKKVFPEPGEVLKSDEMDLVKAIYPAGLAVQKSKTIRVVLRIIKDQLGEYSLESLKGNSQLALDFLCKLPGVGPKTAACTMLFGLGLPQFPVDVHIQRIVGRLGWVSGKGNLMEVQQSLSREIPADLLRSLHILLLNLGRQYCRPHHPNCDCCPVGNNCRKLF